MVDELRPYRTPWVVRKGEGGEVSAKGEGEKGSGARTDHVLRVDGILEKLAPHLEERRGSEEGIRPCLMLWSYPRNLFAAAVGGKDEQQLTPELQKGEGWQRTCRSSATSCSPPLSDLHDFIRYFERFGDGKSAQLLVVEWRIVSRKGATRCKTREETHLDVPDAGEPNS